MKRTLTTLLSAAAGLASTLALASESNPHRQLLVTDTQGQPVAGAQVLIGARADMPFAGNILTTDVSGTALLPNSWKDAQPVTISAQGFVRTTYFGRTPETAARLVTRAIPNLNSSYVLRGEASGFGDLRSDGILDVALVTPMFSRSALSAFRISDILSTEVDEFTIFGQGIKLASNIDLPQQTEWYFLPLSLAKPSYRQFFTAPGKYGVAYLHGRFSVGEMVSSVKNHQPFLELVNKFNFLEGSLRQVDIKSPESTLNVPVNEIRFQPLVSVQAPNLENNLSMISVAIPETNGVYYISDVKNLESRETKRLSFPASGVANGLVLHVLRPPLPSRGTTIGAQSAIFSSVIVPASRQPQGVKFLGLVSAPKVAADSLTLSAPSQAYDVTPLMTQATLIKIEVLDNGSFRYERQTPEWDLYAAEWATKLDLPQLPTPVSISAGHMRWEATFSGVSGASKLEQVPTAAPENLEMATHFSRTAIDF